MSDGSAPNRVRQNPSLIHDDVGAGPFGFRRAETYGPRSAGHRTRRRSARSRTVDRRSAASRLALRATDRPDAHADPAESFEGPILLVEIPKRDVATLAREGRSAARSHTMTRRSASGYGSGRTSVASASANIALLAPMPSASVRTATAVNAGDDFSCRNANLHVLPALVEPLRESHLTISLSAEVHTGALEAAPTSPSRASTISRAIRGSIPFSTSSRVRISTWKAISRRPPDQRVPATATIRSERLIGASRIFETPAAN